MPKKTMYSYLDELKLYQQLISNFSEIEIKGSTMPYTSNNGNMFSFMDKTGKMALRLPKDTCDVFIKKYKTKLCEAHGTILKEYVVVPDILLANTKELKNFFKESLEYTKTLKSKTSKK